MRTIPAELVKRYEAEGTRQLAENFPPDSGPQLTSAPVGHFIGMLTALLIPVLEGTAVNLADVWDPARVLTLMASDGLTVGAARRTT
jgi:hypothetical protein